MDCIPSLSMDDQARCVLYIAKTSKGGSAFSLYHLVRGLEPSRYQPVVLFYTQERSYIEERLDESGIEIIMLSKRTRTGGPQKAPTPAASLTLDGREHGVTVAPGPSFAKRRDIACWLEAHFGKGTAQTYIVGKAFYRFLRHEISTIWPIVRAIRANEIDLVHVNNGLRNSKAGIVAAWLTKTPCVCHVRMLHQLNDFERTFARFVTVFVHISRAVAEGYTKQGISPAKGIIVHNAIDLDDYSQDFDVALIRSEFGLTAQEPLVGIVGRLDWWKGHEYYLEAMAEAAQQVPNLRGLVVGEPQDSPRNREYCSMLRSLTRSLGLEDRIVFTGFRGDVPRLMSAMDVIVLPSSNSEPFGRVAIEGMAAGKPVVATAAGGVLDIIEDGINGVLVPPRDSRAIAAALLELLSDRQKTRQIGLAARQRVESKFTVQGQVATIQAIYDNLLAGPTDRRNSRAKKTGPLDRLAIPVPDAECGQNTSV